MAEAAPVTVMDVPRQPAEQAALTLIAWFKQAVTSALLLAVLLFAVLKCPFYSGSTFEREGWNADVEGDDGVRYPMGEWLAQREALAGMTRDDVVELLGAPVRHGKFREWNLIYELGPARGFLAMGRDFLVIKLDSSRTVIAARIMTDG